MRILVTSVFRFAPYEEQRGFCARYAFDPDGGESEEAFAERVIAEERAGAPEQYVGLDVEAFYVVDGETAGYAHGEMIESGGL